MLRVTEPRGQRFKIEGRQGRYEGLTIWQTKQCGPECKDFRGASLRSVFGVCTKGVAWKVITKNRLGRKLRACQVNRVDHRSLEEKAQTYKRLAGVFECLSNPDRLRILELLST